MPPPLQCGKTFKYFPRWYFPIGSFPVAYFPFPVGYFLLKIRNISSYNPVSNSSYNPFDSIIPSAYLASKDKPLILHFSVFDFDLPLKTK